MSTTGRSALAPAQCDEQPVGADAGHLEPLVEQRELAGELGQEPLERVGVDPRGVAVADGRDADEGLQGAHRASLDGQSGHGLTVVLQRPRWTRFVRRSRRAGDPAAPASARR